MAQVTVPNVSDEPYPKHKTPLARIISHKDGIELFHYGFCREREKFFRKAKLMERSYFGRTNPKWDTMDIGDDEGFAGMQEGQVMPYTGSHPSFIQGWLKERFP